MSHLGTPGNCGLCKRCEVSEHATHRSSPHGPCEPSARVTGWAQTYATDLPKRDSTLAEAASERDQHSLHHHIISPAIRPRSCTVVTWIQPFPHDPRLSTPSYNATSPRTWCSAQTASITTQCLEQGMTGPLPWRVAPLFPFLDDLSHRMDLPRA
jgi:hypothetical protein